MTNNNLEEYDITLRGYVKQLVNKYEAGTLGYYQLEEYIDKLQEWEVEYKLKKDLK